jgi:hypothetical protein
VALPAALPESEDEYDSADEIQDQSGAESVSSSDQDERKMRRRDRRHRRESESEGSTVDSQFDSESDVSEQSYDTPSEVAEPVDNWNDTRGNNEHLLHPIPQGQIYDPGTFSRDPRPSASPHLHSTLQASSPAWTPAVGFTHHSPQYVSSPNPLPTNQTKSSLPSYVIPTGSKSNISTNPPTSNYEDRHSGASKGVFFFFLSFYATH